MQNCTLYLIDTDSLFRYINYMNAENSIVATIAPTRKIAITAAMILFLLFFLLFLDICSILTFVGKVVIMNWLALVLVVFGFIGVKRSIASKQEKADIDSFWTREEQANSIRKQDISQLEYITIPLDLLPFRDTNNTKLQEYQDIVRNLSEYKILNLTGISNTDLKLKYGPANLESLSLADQRFTTLARTLSLWGNLLYESGDPKAAATVLEFGVKCKSDVSATYLTLAKIYKESDPGRISELKSVAESLNSLTKTAILNGLAEIEAG